MTDKIAEKLQKEVTEVLDGLARIGQKRLSSGSLNDPAGTGQKILLSGFRRFSIQSGKVPLSKIIPPHSNDT